jgi:hypothetical protein
MMQPSCANRPFDFDNSLLEILREIAFVKNQHGPASRLECLVPPPVTQVLCASKVMSAIVLNGQPALTIPKVARW